MSAPQLKLKAFGLWEKTSAAGNRYFVGRLGGCRVLVLSNRDRGKDGEPDWHVFFVDGEKPAKAPEAERGFGSHKSQRKSTKRPPSPSVSSPMYDDALDDLWRDGDAA